MPNQHLRGKEGIEERRVWELLVRNFSWRVPPDFSVRVLGRPGGPGSVPVRLQVFEIAVAAIFAHLRPEFEWYVTPNLPDGGLDFVGQGRFLEDKELGIAAGITVGGQCKKRSQVKDIVGEISGSLARMAATINPTFFVVALASRLTQSRVIEARRILELAHGRHCHILDRHQIEGLISDHLAVIDPILRESLSDTEKRAVVNYFGSQRKEPSEISIDVRAPVRVLAGVPFRVHLSVQSPLLASHGARLWWKSKSDGRSGLTNPSLTVIGPIGVDSAGGIDCLAPSTVDDPLSAQISIEMLSYSVGRVDLGEVIVDRETKIELDRVKGLSLGEVHVVENVRPRFFERPLRAALTKLSTEYDRTLARGVNSIAVVGAGGSGKSRLCEEFSLEKRRRGCHVVQAKQTKTLDDPHRVLADLLIGLAGMNVPTRDPADGVIRAISQYDQNLSNRSASAIRSIIGTHGSVYGTSTDQEILSSLLVLIFARTRSAPLIIHLQDLHWCTTDVLILFERLIWQLEMTYASGGVPLNGTSGTLLILEGRIWESQHLGTKLWSTQMFEAFLEKLACPTVNCAPFEPPDSLEFVRRLFEDHLSARRLVDTSLLTLQTSLTEQIHRTAGGNPFHTLEQIKLLRERRILAQNPETGLLYMIQPPRDEPMLPDTVFESIKLRWQYLKSRKPELATLLWGASLLEDRIPGPLFRHLWRGIGPDLSLAEIEATGFLWAGNGEQADVSFRHENYFQSLRRLETVPTEQRKVVEIYAEWFSRFKKLDAFGQFSWARILMQSPVRDADQIRNLLRTALTGARRRGDMGLARRVLTNLLDFTWSENAQSTIKIRAFLKCCEDEVELCRSLLNTDRLQAAQRIDYLRDRIRERLSFRMGTTPTTQKLQFQLLTADLLHSQILFNDRKPSQASDVAAEAVRDIKALGKARSIAKGSDWQILEMEALHSYAVALALGGEVEYAIEVAEQAVEIARKSATPFSLDVMSTYANILLAKDIEGAEAILRDCLVRADAAKTTRETFDAIAINLGMALLLEAHRLKPSEARRAQEKLAEASKLIKPVFSNSFRVGRYPDAGAAALLLGIISALSDDNDGDEVSWFAQAVTASARGCQMETLWRSHINLATALHRTSEEASESLRDHARAALEIIEDTLSPYPQPDRSTRFNLVVIPLAHAVRFLIQLGDEMGFAALERYPLLKNCFQDVKRGVLRQDRGGYRSHEWLKVEQWDYVIY